MSEFQFSVNGKEVLAHGDDPTLPPYFFRSGFDSGRSNGFSRFPRVMDLIDRPHHVRWGSGEPSEAKLLTAMSDAVFDAMGVRLRCAPFEPASVLVALKKSSGDPCAADSNPYHQR